MAMLNAQSGFTTDPETGCVRGYNDYEQCRANFFLKKQNQILQQQKSAPVSAPATTSSNTELEQLRAQIEQQKTETESLKVQQATPQNFENNHITTFSYSLIGIGVIVGLIAGLVIAKLFKSHK